MPDIPAYETPVIPPITASTAYFYPPGGWAEPPQLNYYSLAVCVRVAQYPRPVIVRGSGLI